ncbi:hypothetical protein CYMTET_31258 [Cymbomonas tetramitiformis]|uniref:Uncharacterized protein n=1 Tax=Cymbomonas tetramitiformis TaxID=36881 RepID=A0AAE0KT52_9CHLO|nr:hypothetical protein CYMTET_31258 [Cymbomonas tetramitiformis]
MALGNLKGASLCPLGATNNLEGRAGFKASRVLKSQRTVVGRLVHGGYQTAKSRGISQGALRQSVRDRRGPRAPKALPQYDTEFDEEFAVPKDQRPVNELNSLRESPMYGWGMLDLSGYGVRVGALWTAMLFIGGPIADVSYPLSRMPLECILAASCGSFFIVALASLRIFLGWSYVSDRLLSAVVEYEETGWYDGQLWVKSPEVLARDRMLGSYQVKPVLDRMKTTLLASGAALLASSLLLGAVTAVETEESYRPRVTNDGITYRTALREDDDVFSLDNLDYDDEAAAAEAAAAGRTGLPAYCGDRYYKAVAGADNALCKW